MVAGAFRAAGGAQSGGDGPRSGAAGSPRVAQSRIRPLVRLHVAAAGAPGPARHRDFRVHPPAARRNHRPCRRRRDGDSQWCRHPVPFAGDLELVIAGAPGRASVFADARLDDLPPRVRLVGRVDDDMLPSLYAEAEWFVYLSLYEGFGLPPLEALACGTPVIVSDIAVFREVTADASIAVDPQATGAVADALVQAVEDSASRKILAERGLRQAEKFDWRETARRTREVLERFG